MQLKHIIAFLLTFITLSMEVVSHLMDENDEHQLQFLVRVDANKDEKISYKELIDAKIEQNKDEIAKYLELQENDKVENFKALTAQNMLLLMQQYDTNADSFLDKNELNIRTRGRKAEF